MTNNSTGKRHWLKGLIKIALICVVVTVSTRAILEKRTRAVDARIVADIEPLLLNKLANLPQDSEITRRYGKFVALSDIRWSRADHSFRLVERIDWFATAQFEKARTHLDIHIDHGPTIDIAPMEMNPDEQWLNESGGNVYMEDGYFRIKLRDEEAGTMGTMSSLSAWAKHPRFKP